MLIQVDHNISPDTFVISMIGLTALYLPSLQLPSEQGNLEVEGFYSKLKFQLFSRSEPGSL